MSELNAYLDGELCGTFTEKNGQITFSYSEEYEGQVHLFLSMLERNKVHKNKVALPFLKGLLPDNTQAISNMAREAGISAGSVFSLLGHYGQDVAGALQLLPPGTPSSDANRQKISSQHLLDEASFENLLHESRNFYRQNTRVLSDEGSAGRG
ncbi:MULTISPECIES: HipA N-terminal domain-containing protein [unclassified Rothia (in: high G+C Gram-positive bacteria)]|uniref:HipA N-terminal domain-containing protein n=1 Tax=unclassified Rothia (in: high G+C Gram-positive bacteria) TaxID=2689056 RepID=UPI00195B97E1|nr:MULTISPECIES: HipA N-terminal domain-containing protein [unclassified Rothia (in: high G+C Gram-positive bacteria)]MBM7051890.1 HipA N-terminal domain-containing protein [Rothia sp. ZJ1223]QRZ62032.1 HipA N-terminal domain-containing protein [Rothia sp. ZJ932]